MYNKILANVFEYILLYSLIILIPSSCVRNSGPGKLVIPNIVKIEEPNFYGELLEKSFTDHVKLKQIYCKNNNLSDEDNLWLSDDLYGSDYKGFEVIEKPNGIYNFSVDCNPIIPQSMEIKGKTKYLVDGWRSGKYHIYSYGDSFVGGDYLLITDSTDTKVFKFLDFSSFVYASPKIITKYKDFIDQHIQYAQIVENILYISHYHLTYAEYSCGNNGYISAIDMNNNHIQWTSKPKMCNTNFIVYGNSIITGYGFTEEPDFLYILDKKSGQKVGQTKLLKAPGNILKKGKSIYVCAYCYDYIFELI